MHSVNDPHVPFTLPLNEPPIPGSVIEIHGRHHHHDTFVVELLAGPHIPLHLSFRFHHEHQLVINAAAHGRWGAEVRVHNPIPKHDHHFTIRIRVHDSHYDIEVDGHNVATFHHRFPYSTVQAVGCHGDVHIKHVNFQGFHFHQGWNHNQHNFGHGGYVGYGTPSYVAPVISQGHPLNQHYNPYQ